MDFAARQRVAVSATVASIVLVIALLVFTDTPLPVRGLLTDIMGWILKAGGSAIVIWAIAHLRFGVLGRVRPLRSQVICSGPYRFVRHPVYLGLFLTMSGIAIGLNNAWGLAATVVVFIPSFLIRARLEEQALAECFGSEWSDYRRSVGFVIPWRVAAIRGRSPAQQDRESRIRRGVRPTERRD